MGNKAGSFVRRWTLGEGGFLGEVTLQRLSVADSYVLQDGVPCYELTNLYVHPKRRGKGWATQLMETALEFSKKRGADVFLRVVPYGCAPADSTRLIKFYRSYGFKQVRRGDKLELVLRW